MNRTSRRRKVFRSSADIAIFMDLLSQLPGRFGVKVHGYALMSNHYHLLLARHARPLSQAMAWLGTSMARKKNDIHGWDGPLFRGRYRNRLVLDEGYWLHLLAYVHLNPVRAGQVDHPDHSTWTSHRAYAGLEPAPPWLEMDDHLELYGSRSQYRQALDDLVLGRSEFPDELQEEHLWQPANTDASRVEYPPCAVSTLSEDEALRQVAELTGVDLDTLSMPRRGRAGNLPRTLAAWWLCRAAAVSREKAGALLNMNPGSVGAAAHRVKTAEGQLAEWRDELLSRFWAPFHGGESAE